MLRDRLTAFALSAQILGAIFLLLDSIRTAAGLPKEGVIPGNAGVIASAIFQWANVIGFSFLFVGFALQAVALRQSRSQSPAMPPQRANTSTTPNVGELVLVSDAPTVRTSPVFEALLNSAGHLLASGQHSAAVLVAQTAIEVCTERIINKLIAVRAAFLGDWTRRYLRNYNISDDEVWRFFQAVSSDAALVTQDFWTSNRLRHHVELRNHIAHRGRSASPTEAQASIKVAREVIQYLSSVAAVHGFDLGETQSH